MQQVKEYSNKKTLDILVGHNQHILRTVAEKMNCQITLSGNKVTLEGGVRDVPLTSEILDRLYVVAQQQKQIYADDIEQAIAQAHGIKEPGKSGATILRTTRKQVTPRTQTQADFMEAMQTYDMVFGTGPAGTGKTFLAVAKAVDMFLSGHISKIILTRPAVEAGENLGFLPGDLKEKIDPYLRPLYDALYELLPADVVERKLQDSEIEIAPLAYMRGRTLTHAFIIVDEAQNTTPMQMKMVLTRLGEGSHMVINGDLSQTDLPKGVHSGLADAIDVCRSIPEIKVIEFTEKDVVRNGLVSKIVRAYDVREKNNG
ncbi:MAG: PhoH family protein [Alphaproteobacteria bacterium]|nr:PhoH family protein [Alphaproteobacteria bacterium]